MKTPYLLIKASHQILCLLCLLIVAPAMAQQDVAFKVDMTCAGISFTNVYVTGPWADWCGDCYQLTDDDGDNVFEATFSLPDGDQEYKFAVDNWVHQEDLVDDMIGGATCAPITDYYAYANRVVNVVAGASTSDVYGRCDACPNTGLPDCEGVIDGPAQPGTACDDGDANTTGDVYDAECNCAGIPPGDVTFSVDMNCAGVDFTTVYVTGPFADWCGDCFPLSDEDGDNIWTASYGFQSGTLEYKYEVDNWTSQEDLVDDMLNDATCAPVTDYNSYANRTVEVVPEGVSTNDTYGSCQPCPTTEEPDCLGEPGGPAVPGSACDDGDDTTVNDTYNIDCQCLGEAAGYPVNFSVDMNNSGIDFDIVYVTGPWTDWCGNCFPLSDEDSDGIWKATYDFPAGEHEYLYEVDDWAMKEDLIDDMIAGASCAPVTDYYSFANRVLTSVAGGVDLMDSYGCCENCSAVACVAEAGSFDIDGSGAYCLMGNSIKPLVSGENSDFANVSILTFDDAAFTIVDINTSGNLSAMEQGTYRVHSLNLDPAEAPADLNALIGLSALDVLGTLVCYDLETAAAPTWVVPNVEVTFSSVCDEDLGVQSFTVNAFGGLAQYLAEDSDETTSAEYSVSGAEQATLAFGETLNIDLPLGTALDLQIASGGCTATVSSDIDCTTLDVQLLSFQAQRTSNAVALDWYTASEHNSDYFSVERSANGIDFSEIGRLTAAGNSNMQTAYAFTDLQAGDATTYYRLKMVDFEGTFEYSKVAQVRANTSQNITVWPTVVTNSTQIELMSLGDEIGFVRLSNLSGQEIYRTQLQVDAGLNLVNLDASNWTPGLYVLEISFADHVVSQKLLKQ